MKKHFIGQESMDKILKTLRKKTLLYAINAIV